MGKNLIIVYEYHNGMVVLNTERLILRELMESDFDAIHEYSSDPEVVKYMQWGPNTPRDTREFILSVIARQHTDPREDYELAIIHPVEGLIGGCGIRIKSMKDMKADIGYILKKSMWGQGYCTEAAGALIHFGFHQLGMHRIEASCDTRNIGSYRVMEKNGMQREGILRLDTKIHGIWRDSYIYSILEHEFWNE